jgi:SagB-type dehydrogenase family enzyme
MNPRPALAHQRYSELADEAVCLDVLAFNAHAHYALLPQLGHAVRLTHLSDAHLANLVFRESDVAGCGERIRIDTVVGEGVAWRQPSPARFDPAPLGFADVLDLLARTLVSQPSQPGTARMPYPSGGALYPVLPFLCRTSHAVTDWPAGQDVFQVLPFSRSLNPLPVRADASTLLAALSGDAAGTLGQPAFALVYAVHLDKALFKYRHRGFRLAQMEVGSMYQRVTEQAQAVGLASRVWAGFSDGRVASRLGIDATQLLPMVVQFLGQPAKPC